MCEATANQTTPPAQQQASQQHSGPTPPEQGPLQAQTTTGHDRPAASSSQASLPGPSRPTGRSGSAGERPPREELTPHELALLARVDSLLFGVVRMHLPENQEKKDLLQKGVRALEQVIVDVRKGKARRKHRRRLDHERHLGDETALMNDGTNGVTDLESGPTASSSLSRKRNVPLERTCAGDADMMANERTAGKNDVLVEVKEEPMDVDDEGAPRVNGHDGEDIQRAVETSQGQHRTDEEVAQLNEFRVNGSCSPETAADGRNRPGRPGPSEGTETSGSQSADSIDECDDERPSDIPVELWAKLGHLNLLLEDYEKALSAYQQYFQRRDDSWNNLAFMYGLAMVYYHYSQFEWAIRAFREILYLEPGFCRAAEVHARLGLMYKVRGDFVEAQRCFEHVARAIQNSETLSISLFELQFHQAHLCEVQGKLSQAKDQYEALLENPVLPRTVKADVLRQLGWMYHSQPLESLGPPLRTLALPPLPASLPLPSLSLPPLALTLQQQQRQTFAIQCLQKSIECDPTSGQSLYFLGRCFAAVGRVHDAFISYRNSVDKAEANADTWCSIGVLYQQQSQPMDALQAYICAVQLDKLHSPAWLNLGVLYEAVKQPADALKCYSNALRGSLFSPDSNLNTCQMP
ncbi:histone demethylase UTY-like [Tropilaelaps mercedesae]|uniref:Histone demethylase UTY-like n=1 Tax=Tropilaelaps mercedesae TaxID=418985 RepID=A0A1V9WYQ6_9ACAR|nr:histone demethylase UTY-like [Tropilaelaps mercedesae]